MKTWYSYDRVIAWMIFLATSVVVGCGELSDAPEVPDPKMTSGRLSFEVNFEVPEGAKSIRLWLPYLVSNDYQTIGITKVTGNFTENQTTYEPANGNVMLYAEWDQPQENVATLSYSVSIQRQEIRRTQFPAEEDAMPPFVTKFLGATSLGPIDGEVAELAGQIVAGRSSIREKSRAIYDYIVENSIRNPDVEGCGEGDVLSLLKNLSGKCVDLSSVYVALARSIGVPAREVFGTRISKPGDITSHYHCRAEFYLPGYGWVPVDPSDVRKLMLNEDLALDDPKVQAAREYYFGSQTETYVDFGTGRDIVLNPSQQGKPLNYFMYPYIEVDGVGLGLLQVYKDALQVQFEPAEFESAELLACMSCHLEAHHQDENCLICHPEACGKQT